MTLPNPKRLKVDEEAARSPTMKKETKCNLASSNFGDVVKTKTFVDKTSLIETIFEETPMVLITAPRRFGKSTNMNMVKTYVEMKADANGIPIDKYASANYQSFKNTMILENEALFDEHFAAYPVIHADFIGISGKTFNEVLEKFREMVHAAFKQHKYLLKSDKLDSGEISKFNKYCDDILYEGLTKTNVEMGLQFLSECLYKHFDCEKKDRKKVFVLIDEYDAPITNALLEEEVKIEDVNKLLCDIFKNTLKSNKYVERALLTGISYFASVGLSGANNIDKYMFLDDHPFLKYYGLTEPEVDKLLSTIEEDKREVVKKFYNGYCSRKNVKLFSLWSLFKYLQTGELKSHWISSGLMCGLCKALRFPSIQIAIEKLLKKKPLTITIFRNIKPETISTLREIILGHTSDEIISNPDLFLNFLLQQGYLTYNGADDSVKIPNGEIHEEFTNELVEYFGNGQTIKLFEACSVAFNEISVSDDDFKIEGVQKFVKTFQEVVHTVSYNVIKNNERVFHSLLFCVICRANFEICDDAEFFGSRSRPDLICRKGKIGFIFEVKYKMDSKKALQEIISKEYYNMFDNKKIKKLEDIKYKVYVGLAVDKNSLVNLAVLVNSLKIKKAQYFKR